MQKKSRRELIQFQFHKVRLKGIYPPGVVPDTSEFQFHKVRLKELLIIVHVCMVSSFNSIRYD